MDFRIFLLAEIRRIEMFIEVWGRKILSPIGAA